ncbi:MAG: ribokinase [Propionicimonas sp.]|jgi:ribokinase
MRVAVVGSYGVGLTMRVNRMPAGGETLSDGVFSTGHGGKGSNQAVAAARLGAEVSLLTAVGADTFGTVACELWRDEGVKATILTTGAATMVGVILVEPSGENRIVIAPGALAELSPADVDAFASEIAAADILVTGFEIPVPVARRALQIARSHGVRTLLNPAPAVPLDAELWELVDVLTPNQSEAAVLTGEPVATPDACADAIRARFAGVAVLTLGGEGCLLDTPDGTRTRVPAVRPRQVVDTTGAGDAFTGAFAVALARGDELVDAVRYATAAGAHAVATAEVIPSLARPSDIAALLGQ